MRLPDLVFRDQLSPSEPSPSVRRHQGRASSRRSSRLYQGLVAVYRPVGTRGATPSNSRSSPADEVSLDAVSATRTVDGALAAADGLDGAVQIDDKRTRTLPEVSLAGAELFSTVERRRMVQVAPRLITMAMTSGLPLQPLSSNSLQSSNGIDRVPVEVDGPPVWIAGKLVPPHGEEVKAKPSPSPLVTPALGDRLCRLASQHVYVSSAGPSSRAEASVQYVRLQ